MLSDAGSDPAWVAADLLSQAEHDVCASAVLVTDSRSLAEAVQKELEEQLETLPRRDIAAKAIADNGKIIVTADLGAAVEAVNRIAPEHLELCVADPFALLPRIRNAGSVFLGRSAPEALGDYFAGPNHTLPTSGTAGSPAPWGWTTSVSGPVSCTTPGRPWRRPPPGSPNSPAGRAWRPTPGRY